ADLAGIGSARSLAIVDLIGRGEREFDLVLFRPRVRESDVVLTRCTRKFRRRTVLENSGLEEHTLTGLLRVIRDLEREALNYRLILIIEVLDRDLRYFRIAHPGEERVL